MIMKKIILLLILILLVLTPQAYSTSFTSKIDGKYGIEAISSSPSLRVVVPDEDPEENGDGGKDTGSDQNTVGGPVSHAYGALILLALGYGLFMRHRNSIKDKE